MPSECRDWLGSIPACAGGPWSWSLASAHYGVYPRVCGGTVMVTPSSDRLFGLSPRVRGDPTVVPSGGSTARSIPACAGGPNRTASTCHVTTVYPRVCGGTQIGRIVQERMDGLSPRVRGDLEVRGRCRICGGSIPACAGGPVFGCDRPGG